MSCPGKAMISAWCAFAANADKIPRYATANRPIYLESIRAFLEQAWGEEEQRNRSPRRASSSKPIQSMWATWGG